MPPRTIEKPRRRDHRLITRAVAQVVLHVKSFFKTEKEEGKRLSLQDVTIRTMKATHLGRNTVTKIKTQADVEAYSIDPKEERTRAMTVPSVFIRIIRQAIRELLLTRQEMPTLNSIIDCINTRSQESDPHSGLTWTYGRTTLYRFMQRYGFKFLQRKTHYEYTRERADIAVMRENYLLWLEKYRDDGYEIYYQDETWVNKNIAKNKVWTDINSPEIYYRVPSGKGARCIVSHLGSANTGLLPDALLIFLGEKGNQDADYHTEMNSEVFLGWLKDIVFPKLKQIGEKCVLVLDRATYHCKLTENTRPVRRGWRKQQMADAIARWGGPPSHWPSDWQTSRKITKNLMFEHAQTIAPAPKYRAQDLADQFEDGEFSIKILMLPVAHPELNPIELVWAYMKNYVAFHNFKFNMTAVQEDTEHVLRNVSKEMFSRFCARSMKEEARYREMDEVMDLTGEISAHGSEHPDNNAPANGSEADDGHLTDRTVTDSE